MGLRCYLRIFRDATIVAKNAPSKPACFAGSHLCRLSDILKSAMPIRKWSGRQDSNLRPSAPKADALARLRHAPFHIMLKGFSALERRKKGLI